MGWPYNASMRRLFSKKFGSSLFGEAFGGGTGAAGQINFGFFRLLPRLLVPAFPALLPAAPARFARIPAP